VWGAPLWLAVLDHGGLEVVPADICGWEVGPEVSWWCSSSRRLRGFGVASVVGPGSLRWEFLVPTKVCLCGAMATLWGCTELFSRRGGGGELVRYYLSECVLKVRCCPGESLHRHECQW
jgi:hypothetical protein